MTDSQTPPQPLFDTLNQHVENKTQQINKNYSYAADFKIAFEFLYSYRGSEATYNSYRRELEKFLQWSWTISKKSIDQMTRQDIEAYVEFCQNPPLHWIGTKNVARYLSKSGERVPNPHWRPFVVSISKIAHKRGINPNPKQYTLSQNATQAIFSILGSFYGYLIQENYIAHNPVTQIRQKSKYLRKQQNTTIIRKLSELQWVYVIDTAENLSGKEPAKHERTLFIMNALYGMYLRISELAASQRWVPQMGHFHKDSDNHWWFTTVGKGNKQRDIAVSDDMLSALKRYRQSLGLSILPTPGELTPLIPKTSGKGPINSTRQIRSIVQMCFDAAVDRMMSDGMQEDSEELKVATVHWLRHTGISEDVKTRPREHVRDDAGHGSSAITDKYIDVELRARHQSNRKKKINPHKA